ncbi:MAG: NAD-dependent epimerase/dehydratase family protein [Saprospiraceae bacterium]|jgi:UDP-glucose 4-epimerase|uniref:NAD-dependent epimerase/dehydratase family protein n=1 Tax=Candidatus Brachybacter algidus TaxID=2982024 RepID=UPI001B50F215|nr:NAD-dependent epimerase/dehydratase family protein [Candidatus Brachybacter algidus]MBP8893010.1 NAD-dependent epimerase/dehydratase family protein [Saprospiraceae bacterium]MBK6373014.1 NAD-dependent epimerase/dehydratase family protein [Candidatus Brachybacter algidus]MBK6447669.1 NAD-dependent epimerase/dehydratase family protein [Candidatus Brachybacter algidus]MBK8354857.1 NAD-dependent epimerase/dehydratase family protein [Candidatus Brachybacter algidus]MBK8603057.1 NAD-dependent epi
MKVHLVSGGCGFVGRNMVKRLYNTTKDNILFIDDLSVGTDPSEWLDQPMVEDHKGIKVYGTDARLYFLKSDFRDVVHALARDPEYIKKTYGLDFVDFGDIYHYAAIVGGRAKIDGDPMMVALDLSIDAEFFYYITRHKPERVLYPSSSAAYPVNLQTESGAIALTESDIDFNNMGQPDMTYGWSKLTGEYLAKIAAQYYDVNITCIRPFSGYGEDQDLTYPIPSLAKRAALKENPFEVWGTGHQGRDFVHIDDVIDCIQLAMNHIHDGTAINIGMGKLTSFMDIIKVMTSFAGYNPEIKQLLDKPVGVHSRYCDMTFVENTIGWKAKISVEEGMKRVYDAALQKFN